MKKWSEVLTSPEYQALDEQSRSEAKNQYFNEIVTPKAIKTYGNEELPAIRNSFFNTNYNELDPIDITPEQPTEPFQFSGGTSRGAGAVGEWEEAPFSMFKETMRQLPSAIGQTMLQAPVKTLTEGIKIQNEAIEAGKMGAIKGTYDTISGLVKFGWDYLKKQGEFIPQNITQEEYDTSALFAVDRFVSGLSQKAKQKFLQSDYIKRKEQIMKAHPIATKVGEFGSDIGLLVATTALVPGFADEAAVLTKIATKYPKIALAIKGFVRSGTKGGAYGFIKELSETQDVKKALKVGGKTGLYWGSVFGAHGALENPYVRNILQTMSAHTISKIALLRAKHERGEEMSLKDWATPEMQTILIATLGVITTPAHQRAIKAQRTAIMKAAKQELYREPKSYKEAVETLKKAERVILPGGKEIPTRKAPELAVWNKPTKSFIKPEGKIVSRGSKMIDAKGKEVYKWDKFWKEFRPIRTEAGKAPKVIEVRVEKKLPVKVGEKEQILKIAAKEKVTLAKAREILKKQAEITPTKPITPPTPIKSITEPVRAVKGAVKPTKAPVKAIITDPAEVQKIKNSITDGELTLRAGTFNGKKLSAEKLDAVRRSVENAKAKIGIKDKLPPHLQKIIDKKGYTIEDVTPEGYAPAEPTPPKPISKELEPLAKEAVKYKAEGKSAEEFVEKQPKVYHGTSEKFDIFDVAKAHDTEGKQLGLGWGRGVISFTRSKGEASKYIDTVKRGKAYEGKHPQVKEAYISLKKPFKMDMHGNSIESANYERWRRARDGWKDTETDIYWGDISSGKNRRAEAFVKQLKKEGYDGIISIDTRVDFEGRATKGGADEIGVFYNKNIKTKAQLTDIYNKATAKPISKELEPLANELETKFIHSKWYKTKVENKWVSYKTKAKALDEMAKSGDFLIDEKINYKKTELANEGKGIFDYEPVYDDVLKYSGKEGGTYKLSPVEKKYFMERKKFWDNFKKQEAIKKAKDPLEQAKKYKIDKASLEYNLKHSKRELQYATRDNDNERIEFWNKKIGEDEKKLNNFLSRKKATAKVEKPAEVVKPENEIQLMYEKAIESADKAGHKFEVKRLEREFRFIGGDITVPSEMRKLRQIIHAWQFRKGLSKKDLQETVRKITGHLHTTHKDITAEQLKSILAKMRTIRPKRIGAKEVIKLETEKRITKLQDSLTKQESMTPDDFNRILKTSRIKTARYVTKADFITEREGKDLLQRMLDEAPVIKERITTEKALNRKPTIKSEVNKIDTYLETQIKPEGTTRVNSLLDMRYYTQNMEMQTDIPFGKTWQKLNDKRLEVNNKINKYMDALEKVGGKDFGKIANDKKALQRINDYIASQLPKYVEGKPTKPADITETEKALAEAITKSLKGFETMVRYNRFYDWRDYGTPIPNAPAEELARATKVLETEGDEALKKWLAGRSWGVIGSGYDIGEVIKPRISLSKISPTAMSKGHLKSRQSVVFQRYDRDILKRYAKYIRQMIYLTELRPQMRAFQNLFETNTELFRDPMGIANSLSRNLREMKGQKEMPSALMRWVSLGYSQAMRAIFLDPRKWLRNLHQNAAFYTSPEDILKLGKALSEEDLKYFTTYVSQMKGVQRDYLYEEFPGIIGFRNINKFIDKMNIYPWTDETNRIICYKMKIGKVRSALKKYPDDMAKMMRVAGFGDLEPIQRKYALEILAKDGKDAMARYVAREVTNNVHFLYERPQRSPAAQGGDAERLLSNLLTFRKGYWQRIIKDLNKLKPSRAEIAKPIAGRRRAFRALVAMLVTSSLVGWVYMKITGSKNNPYSPKSITSDLSLGGLTTATQEKIKDLSYHTMEAVTGNDKALQLVINDISSCGDFFVPFYRNTIDSIGAISGYKSIDKAAMRQLLSALDKRYKAKPMGYYKIERNAIEMFQYGAFGQEKENKTKALKTKLSKLRQLNRDNPSKKYSEQIRETAKQLREAASKEREEQRKKRK